MATIDSGKQPTHSPAPAGWYDDPSSSTQLRYWDGTVWTTQTALKAPPEPAVTPTANGKPVAPAGKTNPAAKPPKPIATKTERPWYKRPWVLILGGLLGIGIIGSAVSPPEDTAKKQNASAPGATSAPAPAAPKPIELTVTSPDDGTTVRTKSVLIKGVVSLDEADVVVGGDPATVRNGRFVARVPLHLGDNEVDITAAAQDAEDQSTTVVVTRKRTARQLAALRERRRQRRLEAQRREAARVEAANRSSGQKNALRSAESYIAMTGMSRQGLIEQLSSDAGEGYSVADATYAADQVGADWNAEAVESAKSYLEMTGMSRQGLIEQLSSDAGEGFTLAQAQYAADRVY
jgi:hypothetical protein